MQRYFFETVDNFFCVFLAYFLQLQKIILHLCVNKETTMKTQTNKTETTYDLTLLSISEIAQMMKKHVKIHPWAKPYHTAMLGLTDLNDTYGQDSARSIVLYFLSNARSMTGDFMRAAKKELNDRLNKEVKAYGKDRY